ncbi:MAG: substrate-binding domain-containing protein [Opitutales bacterium]|jgi:ribose transport system substrate-binding protein|nr:substrate-binding domain-containing protein [Opitutales bacterium]MBT5812971.1 substrate-binding domain-containing protein [Opitutales bacterium]MBT6380680.1 substrate-binding domain-containing protein [Opitutales bacterium]
MKKRFLPFSLILFLFAVLIGCTSSDDSANESSNSDKIVIAAIPKATGGDFWETVEQGARRAATELDIELKWEGTVTETEIAEQTKIIENMINLGVDAIALAPLNNQAQRKPVQSAVDNGIPVVVFDSSIDGNAHSSFVATDNQLGGSLGAQFLSKKIGSEGRVVVFRYVQGTASTAKRADGFIATAKAAGLEIAADPFSESGTLEGSKSVVANTLERFIENGKLSLDGIFAANLTTTLGVSSALDDLRSSGIEVDLAFVGFDSSVKLVKEVQTGKIDALIVQSPEKMGYLAVKTAFAVVQGKPVEAHVDTGVQVVTANRLETEPEIRALVGLK